MSVQVKATMSYVRDMENYVNYAAIHCGHPLIEKVEISGDYQGKAILTISAAPAFIHEYKKEIVLENGNYTISMPEINLDDSFFRQELIEAKDGEIKVEVTDQEDQQKVYGFCNIAVHLQPYQHWDGWRHKETMPAFMQPNDTLVASILKRAGEYAQSKGIQMYGYQGRSTETVVMQAECIYNALQDYSLHYISSPASFEDAGQKIRIPRQVLHEDCEQGTCLDLAILYASCLEAASLNSVLVLIPGHAYSGVWVEENVTLPKNMMNENEINEEIVNLWNEKLVPVECTTFTDNRDISFEVAVQVARNNMPECRCIIDVLKSREIGIYPAYTYTDKPICDIPQMKSVEMTSAKEKLTKIERLQQQAMDISIRNKLLSGKTESFELEFPFDTQRFLQDNVDAEKLYKETKQAILESGMKEEKFDENMRKLRLNDREARKEKGKGNLYLAMNELQWKDADNRTHKAVLYLCPATIKRNVAGGYFFEVEQEGTFFNPVLKEMLASEEYNIDISGMSDQPGNAYKAQIEQLKYLLSKKKGWSVEEDVARLALFNIPNEAIWKGLSDEKVLGHEIVSSLIRGAMGWQEELDEACEEDVVYAYPADSSQADIIHSAFQKKAQVVVGSAGNGKTQTISNIMLEGMKKGMKTLLISEKFSALDVTKQMLEKVGIGMFALSVVEGMHNVSDVTKQIENTLRHLEIPESADWEMTDQLKRYQNAGEKIRRYYELMTQRGSCGKSLEELYNMYEVYRNCPNVLKWPENAPKMDLKDGEYIIEIFAEILKDYDQTRGEHVEYLRYQNMTPEEKEEAKLLVEAVLAEWEKLQRASKELCDVLELTTDIPEKEKMRRNVQFARYIGACPVIGDELDEMSEESEAEDEEKRKTLLADLEKSKDASKWKNILKKYDIPLRKRTEILLHKDAEDIKDIISKLCFGKERTNDSDSEKKVDYRRHVAIVTEGIRGCKEEDQKKLLAAIESVARGQGSELRVKAKEVITLYEVYANAEVKARDIVLQDVKSFERRCPDVMRIVLYEDWKKNVNNSMDLDAYKSIKKQARETGLTELIEQIEQERKQGHLKAEDILDAVRKCWCEYQMKEIYQEIPGLREFDRFTHETNVRHYCEWEDEIREDVKKELLHVQLKRLPNIQQGAMNTPELGKLRQLVKRGKKISIRTLFEEAPNMLSELYPCMLMNPSAAAEYLPTDFPQFDLVIIDEGSQMPTYKALGPISHAKRCMIFGDEQQLPPTRAFQKSVEEDGYKTEIESILDDAIMASLPRKTLRYHYRSENESLIAFSNKKYYNNKVITFPACKTEVSGVSYELVEDGCYDRGGSKTNEVEGHRVVLKVKEIYSALSEDTKETVGIVTMNINQRNLIQSLLVKEAMKDLEFGKKVDELVSVMNLEACQGKEWDHVIISSGYGLDKNGGFINNMGPLGQEGGEKRFNVMITRARKKMYVITSIKPGMLKNVTAQGVNDFNEFLSYARGEIQYDTRDKGVGRKNSKNDSMLEGIAAALRERGYEVHTNIGCSECKVDIGIVSKKDDSCYSLGILTDHFKGNGNAIRDREIIHPEALRRKGWNIYRLHSLSWYASPEGEIGRIVRKIQAIEGEEG